jgi:hypothetical protein
LFHRQQTFGNKTWSEVGLQQSSLMTFGQSESAAQQIPLTRDLALVKRRAVAGGCLCYNRLLQPAIVW